MRCPACGNEETKGTVCSRCATPFPDSETKTEEPRPTPPKKPAAVPLAQPSTTPKEGKHRSRPLHDLDLTLPELDVSGAPSPEPQQAKDKEEPSIKVSDRRHHQEPEVQAAPGAKPQTGAGPESTSEPRAPFDFSSFILSLSASALMAMGGLQLPGRPSGQGSPPKIDLAEAKELIDLLAILETKTKGNLTDGESELLKQTLYNLRLKYVQISRSK